MARAPHLAQKLNMDRRHQGDLQASAEARREYEQQKKAKDADNADALMAYADSLMTQYLGRELEAVEDVIQGWALHKWKRCVSLAHHDVERALDVVRAQIAAEEAAKKAEEEAAEKGAEEVANLVEASSEG